MNWEQFVRYTRRFGWNLDRTRSQFRLQGLRQRGRPFDIDAWENEFGVNDDFQVPDSWTEDIDLVEFDASNYNEDNYQDVADEELLNPEDEWVPEVPEVPEASVPGVLETTPLLGGAGTVPTVPTAIVPTATGLLVGTGAAIGIGVLTGTLFGQDHDDRPPITLPDHAYLGPGNPHDSGHPPVDLDDQISAQHDLDYAKSQQEQHILDADAKATHDFLSDVIDTGNPHSALGALGLGVKHHVEKHTGVIYPNKGTFIFPEWFFGLILDRIGSVNLLMIKYILGPNIIEPCIVMACNMYHSL